MKYLTSSSLFTIQESELSVAPEKLSAPLTRQEASRAPVGFNMNSRNETYWVDARNPLTENYKVTC